MYKFPCVESKYWCSLELKDALDLGKYVIFASQQ